VGGLIALSAAVQALTPSYRAVHSSFAFRGVVLSSPCFAVDPKLATPPLKFAAKVLSAIVPKLVLKGIPASYLSRNVDAVAAYENDPLIWHGGARARVGAELLREMKNVLSQLHSFNTPILLLHGTKDGQFTGTRVWGVNQAMSVLRLWLTCERPSCACSCLQLSFLCSLRRWSTMASHRKIRHS
jgi:alpha-beta hydrolase superfamily lysophospholipase